MFKYTSTLFDAMTSVSEVFLEQTLTRNTRKVKKSEQILADIGSIGSTSNLSGSLDISHQIRGLKTPKQPLKGNFPWHCFIHFHQFIIVYLWSQTVAEIAHEISEYFHCFPFASQKQDEN